MSLISSGSVATRSRGTCPCPTVNFQCPRLFATGKDGISALSYRASRAETKQAVSDNLRVLLDAASRGGNPPDPDFVPADGRSQRALHLAREGLLNLFEGDANGAQALAAKAANLAPGLWAVEFLRRSTTRQTRSPSRPLYLEPAGPE